MEIPVISKLFKSRDKPTNALGSAYSFFFGGTTSGKTVNERTAMQTTAVYACVRILAEMTSFVFRETLMSHLLLWGNAYAQIIRDGTGKVVALYPLMPDKMTVDRTSKGEIYYLYNKEGQCAIYRRRI